MTDKLGKASTTNRGFPSVEFQDYYNQTISLQCSSVIIDEYPDSYEKPGTSALWFGLKDPKVQLMAKDAQKLGLDIEETTGWVDFPLPQSAQIFSRSHLNREQVEGLIERLKEWLENGTFE